MNTLVIYHHLGLGDHIVCNGLVRQIVKRNQYKNYVVLTKLNNAVSVSFMYRDINNLSIVETTNDEKATAAINKLNDFDLHCVGFDKLDNNPNFKSFDVLFYETQGLDFESRWTSFNVVRDSKRETKLFNDLNIKKQQYVFVHDDHRFFIDIKKINSHLKIVKPVVGVTNNIFDYCSVIENAAEVHVIDSSFQLMIDSLNLNPKVFVHRYARPTTSIHHPIYKFANTILN